MKGFKRLVWVAAALTLCFVSANGEANQDAVSSFSVLATDSGSLEGGAVVHSGSVAASGETQWDATKVTIGPGAYLHDGTSISGDTVEINTQASVDTVRRDQGITEGTIRGQEEILSQDVMSLPEFPTPNPGSQPIDVGYDQTVSLQAGSYGDVAVRANATLVLGGGVYHFENLDMGEDNAVLCCEKATDLIINNRLEPGANATIGPCDGSGIDASDIRIYVNGTDGAGGSPNASPEVAGVGYENNIKANIYAPNGTISVKAGSVIEGALIGKDITIGHDVEITLNSAFAE